MKKPSFKLLYPLLFVSVISCSDPKSNDELLKEVEAQMLISNSSEAVINLKNIIKQEPGNSKARFLLGKIYLDNNKLKGAEKELKRSLSTNPENKGALLSLAKTQLNLGQYEDAVKTLLNKEFINEEDKVKAHLMNGQAYLSLNEIDMAKDSISKANELNNNSQHSMFGSALISAYEKNSEDALALIEKILELNSNYKEAILLKGSIHSNQGEYLKAADDYLSYYNKNTDSFGIRAMIAENYMRAEKSLLAKPHIDEMMKINENHPTALVLAAQLKFSEKDFEGSRLLANKALQATNNILAQIISGLSSFYLKNYEQSYYQLNVIADNLPANHQVHKILAVLQVKLGYTDEFNDNINKLEGLSSKDAGLFSNLGMEYAKEGNAESAQKMLNKASFLAPDNAAIKAQLGMIKLFNQNDSGVNELKEAIVIDPNFKMANVALAMNYLKNGNKDDAKNIADEWILSNPNNASAMLLRGNIAMKSGDTEEAIDYFKKASEIDPKNLISLFSLAMIYTSNNEYEESDIYLDKLFSINLEYPLAYQLAVTNSIKLNNELELKKKLFGYIGNNQKAIWPRIMIAKKLSQDNENNKALIILNQLNDYESLPDIYFKTLIEIMHVNKESDEADSVYTKWQRSQPKNPMAYLAHIDYLDTKKNYDKALLVTQNALSKSHFKDEFKLLALESYYLMSGGRFESAANKIDKLVEKNPEHHFALRIKGQLSFAQKKYPDAIKYLSKSFAIKKEKRTALNLIASYRFNRENSKAIDFLVNELKNDDKNITYKKILAELHISKSPNKAIKLYEDIVAFQKNDAVIYNNLAWLYYESNKLEKALSYAQKANKITPNNPQILDTLGLVLIKKNKIQDAILKLNQAHSIQPSNKEIINNLADAYIANKEADKANKVLDKLKQN